MTGYIYRSRVVERKRIESISSNLTENATEGAWAKRKQNVWDESVPRTAPEPIVCVNLNIEAVVHVSRRELFPSMISLQKTSEPSEFSVILQQLLHPLGLVHTWAACNILGVTHTSSLSQILRGR